jgi:subtilisin family serine protease
MQNNSLGELASMRSAFIALAAAAATVIAGSPAIAAEPKFRAQPAAQQAARLRLDASASENRGGSKVYIVQMAADPAIRYQGGIAGFAKSAPEKGERYNARTSQAQMYAERLGQQQDAVLARVGASGGKVYSFRHVFNGFAARMTPQQAAKLRKDKSVLQVWEDQAMALDTDNSPRFLGILDKKNGLRSKHGLRGEDIIIGVLDSGIVQEHPSLDPAGFGPPPADWAGACEAGDGFTATECNNKLIGARFYVDGFGAGNVVPTEFLSPRDSDGHGTHTATTAAGNENVQAVLAGVPVARISGIAPRARVAVYKVCWQAPGAPSSSCFFSDSAAATEQAILDGVDILTFSVGTSFSFIDPQDLAFLFATDAGIFVSRSAGNEGPGPETTAAGEPWVTSVAASTLRGPLFTNVTTVNSPASVAGQYASLESSISKSLQETGPITGDVIAAEPIDACAPLANSLAGGIGLIARGTCDFSVKLTNAANAGAVAVLMYSDARPKTVMGGTATPESLSIPAVMVDNAPGIAIQDALMGGATVNVTLAADEFVVERMTGNVMAGFSSRGPFPTVRDWIKPDITAPGVNILAGATPEPNDGSYGGFFQYLSGTSMSTPHIAGVAALLLEAHPDWTPAMIRSAMMTTARQNVVKEDGLTKADPFDFGAGHVNANKALDPGLVYEAGLLDYLAGVCGTDSAADLFADPAATCAQLEGLGFSTDASDLNLPSIGIAELPGKQTVTRYVTNVSGKFSRYRVTFKAPPGYRVQIKPENLAMQPGETKSYTVTITNRDAPAGEWRFGWLKWADNKGHAVRSPIAVRGQAVVAPDLVQGTGESGSTSFDVTFGYNGPYAAGAHGLELPLLWTDEVEDDPNNSYVFNGPGTSLAYLWEVAPGALTAQWAIYDAYMDGNHDFDMYVYYCPDFLCTLVGQSAGLTSEELVRINNPVNDPNIDDPYLVFLHAYETEGGLPANYIHFDWTDPAVNQDLSNMTVTGPSSAVLQGTGTVNINWAGLVSGAAAKYLGAVSHNDSAGIQGLTVVAIDNDAGAGFCDLLPCP